MVAPAALRLALAGACGLLLLGGVAGAVVVDEDEGTRASTGASASTESASTVVGAEGEAPVVEPVPGSAPGPGAEVAPSTTAAAAGGGAAAATTTSTTGRRGRTVAPGPLVPPKVGSYVYESTSTGAGGPRTQRTTTSVEAVGTEGSTTVQAVTIPLDIGGQQAVARNTVAWGGGAVVRRSVITVPALGQAQLDCVWQPAFPQYASGLAIGKTWTFTTRCVGKLGTIDVAVEQRATRKVTGAIPVAVPNGTVDTWTIADDTTLAVTSPLGAGTVRTVGTQQLAPSLGLPVLTEMTVDARMGAAPPAQSKVVTRLLTRP